MRDGIRAPETRQLGSRPKPDAGRYCAKSVQVANRVDDKVERNSVCNDTAATHGECQICFQHTRLVKSHIIPKSISRVLTGSTGPSLVVPSSRESRPRRIRDGFYARFCCATCEELFGSVDNAFARFFGQLGNGSAVGSDAANPLARTYDGVDPRVVTGFFASVLLRGALSRTEFFSRISLKHSARRRIVRALRQGVLNQDTGVHVILARVTGELGALMTNPHEHTVRGHHCFAVRLPGLLALVFADPSPLSPPLSAAEVGGPLGVLVMERASGLPGEEELIIEAAAMHAGHIHKVLGKAKP